MKTPLCLILSSAILITPLHPAAWAQGGAAIYSTSQSMPPRLPTLGDDQSMSLGAERRLGDKIATEIFRDADYLSDLILDDYLASIWQPLVAAAKAQGELSTEMQAQFAWRVFLVRDKSVNAFALPGGFMGVHTGLIASVDTTDELASVLAHEVSHVTQRHIARGMGKQAQSAPLMVAAIVLGLLAARSNPTAAQATITGSQALAIQNQLNFSRDMEREADRVGMSLMQPAGYAPTAFAGMFAQLEKASRLNDNGSYPYLRSHPLTTERIADMQNRLMGQIPRQPMAMTLALHSMMRARARVLSDSTSEALRFNLSKGQQQLSAPTLPTPSAWAQAAGDLYGAAMAAQQLQEHAQFKSFTKALRAHLSLQNPAGVSAEGVLDKQLRWLEGEGDPRTGRRVDLLLWAQQQLISQPKAVLEALQAWTAQHPMDAKAWEMQAQAQEKLGQNTRALMAQGQWHWALLDPVGALEKYKAAQYLLRRTPTPDFYDAAIVDSKVKEFQTKVNEQAKDLPRG